VGALSDLTDVSSAAQGNGNVLASGGVEYREESITSLVGAHVALSDLSAASHSSLSGVGSSDHHTRYSDSEARSAVEGTTDVADLAGGLGTSGQVPRTDGTSVSWVSLSASDLSDVSPDSDPDAHHAVFEPSDYNPVSDVEAHGNALAIDITGNADTLDGVQGNDYARTDVSETFNSNVGFGGETAPSYAVDVNGTGNFSGDLYAAGSVGVGTTSPSEGLEIGGESFPQVRFNTNDSNSTIWDIGVAGDYAFQIRNQNTSNTHVKVNSGGNVGIGTNSPTYALEVSGDARASGEVEAFLGSDRRLKTRLDPLDSALDRVDQLTGYGFDWREGDAVQPHKRGETDVGLIAQEVEGVLPEAVKTFSGGHSEGYKSVSYDKLVPLLIEAIKDLRSQVQTLQ
jgi:hypothetical protein